MSSVCTTNCKKCNICKNEKLADDDRFLIKYVIHYKKVEPHKLVIDDKLDF